MHMTIGIAQMAKDLGKEEDYLSFIERAQSYKNILILIPVLCVLR